MKFIKALTLNHPKEKVKYIDSLHKNIVKYQQFMNDSNTRINVRQICASRFRTFYMTRTEHAVRPATGRNGSISALVRRGPTTVCSTSPTVHRHWRDQYLGGKLRFLNFVLDRLPPYLVVAYGFELLRNRVKGQMFDNLSVSGISSWRSSPQQSEYCWTGLIQRINKDHFVLYWTTDERTVQDFGVRQLRSPWTERSKLTSMSHSDFYTSKDEKRITGFAHSLLFTRD